MNEPDTKHWLVRPKTIRGLWWGGGVLLAVLTLGDFLYDAHPKFGIDGGFGFYSWYGLLTCAAMVIFAKTLGFFISRKDTYYDDTGH